MNDVAHYIEHEAGQLIRQAREDRARAQREAKAAREVIDQLTRDVRAAQGHARRIRRQLGEMEARYDALLMRQAFEDANSN